MSSLLKEAIVDAKALRETALKSAETTIVEKYSDEVRQTLEKLLEQDELGGDLGGELGADPAAEPAVDPLADAGAIPADPAAENEEEGEEIVDDVNLAATDDLSGASGTGLRGLPSSGEEAEVTVSLDALQEAVAALEAELRESDEIELNEEDLAAVLSEEDVEITEAGGGCPAAEEDAEEREFEGSDEGGMKEVVDIDGLADAIAEELSVDMGAELTGWSGNSADYMKHEMERELASRRSTETEEELKDLKKAQEELVFENKQLKGQLTQYKQATTELKESLQNVNLSNARLLYTNRVLRDTSLNERQKETIVEAISSAGSVTEARTIFDTLQSTAQSAPKRAPKSLSEAINRRSNSSVIRASRKESTSSDSFQDRMKKLAGIK